MSKPDYLPKNMNIEYLADTCSICGKEYKYLPYFKPNTCGKFECVYALAVKRTQEFADAWNRMKKRGES